MILSIIVIAHAGVKSTKLSYIHIIGYDMIRYDSVYLTCSKKLAGSQLSLPHGINRKLKCETKNKMMSVIGADFCIFAIFSKTGFVDIVPLCFKPST